MKRSLILLLILSLVVPVLFLGCEGDDGAAGAPGLTTLTVTSVEPPGSNCLSGGEKIQTGLDDNGNGALDIPEVDNTSYICAAPTTVNAESCSICHNGSAEANGDSLQAIYDRFTDPAKFTVTIDNVNSIDNGTVGFYNVTMTFTIKQNGQPYIDVAGLPSLNQKSFNMVQYFSGTRQFLNYYSLTNPTPTGVDGQYRVTRNGANFAPNNDNAVVFMYIAKGDIGVPKHGRITLYDDVVSVGQAFGDANTYVSAANVAGCEKCHGRPFGQHGFRQAVVSGLNDFVACHTCHYDNRISNHLEFQMSVDVPQRWAEIAGLSGSTEIAPDNPFLTDQEKLAYTFTATPMNDTHMPHAMEFPYPQSMANCVTCHEGKLNMILTDANFVVKTCKSCHPVTGGTDTLGDNDKDGDLEYTVDTRTINPLLKQAPALKSILPGSHATYPLDGSVVCSLCHFAGNGIAPLFNKIHTGYDKKIYTSAGQRYSDAIQAAIDNVSFAGNTLTFEVSVSGSAGGLLSANIKPTVLVGLYGWNSKDYIVGPHERDANNQRNLEAPLGSNHPRISSTQPEAGKWIVTANLADWASLIANGTVKKAEIAVMPRLEDPALPSFDNVVALNAPSKTWSLVDNTAVDDYFQGQGAIVDVQRTDPELGGCNDCHDALATTFHTADRGGNIVVCRLCHTTKSGASHLEIQSRSIDSYAHAIHEFQHFDIDQVDFNDPVEKLHYEEHIEFVYPYFTTLACKSCHNAGKFNVPDQSKSMPGLLSASENTLMGLVRNISGVPEYVTGPATRACGACHRSHEINEDNAGELASLFSHWRTFGYVVENDANDVVLEQVIYEIMAP